jgi:hypothetical protein
MAEAGPSGGVADVDHVTDAGCPESKEKLGGARVRPGDERHRRNVRETPDQGVYLVDLAPAALMNREDQGIDWSLSNDANGFRDSCAMYY